MVDFDRNCRSFSPLLCGLLCLAPLGVCGCEAGVEVSLLVVRVVGVGPAGELEGLRSERVRVAVVELSICLWVGGWGGVSGGGGETEEADLGGNERGWLGGQARQLRKRACWVYSGEAASKRDCGCIREIQSLMFQFWR